MALPISKLVKELRDRLDLTQAELATRLKVSLPTIGRWESGRSEPDALALHTLEQFTRAAGKKCADLVDRYFGDGRPAAAPRRRRARRAEQAPTGEPLDTRSMEGMLWRAACSIRGEKDAPKFKDYILPLVFIKRLSDVFDDEVARLTETYGDEETARSVIEADHSLVRFYIPPEAAWAVVSRRSTFAWPEDRRPETPG